MNKLAWAICVVLAVALTAASGALHGSRKVKPGDMTAAAQRLEALRGHLGPWKMQQSLEMPVQAVNTLQCAGYVQQRYINEDTGESVTLAVIVGPPGPTAVHVPEICYTGADYAVEFPRKLVPLKSGKLEHSAWMTQLQGHDVGGESLRVYYAWSPGGAWKASDDPRWEFADEPFLYKFQLAVHLSAPIASDAGDPGLTFLREFLPAFERAQEANRLAPAP